MANYNICFKNDLNSLVMNIIQMCIYDASFKLIIRAVGSS